MELNVNDNYIVQSANYLNGIDAQRIPGVSLANIDGTRMTSASQMLKHANRYSGPVVSFEAEKGVKLQSLIANVTAWQEGSGNPAPDNVRPIHGWDGITLSQAGFNLWDEEWEVGVYNSTTGEKQYNATAIRSTNMISVIPNVEYYIFNGSNVGLGRIFFYDKDKNFLSYILLTTASSTFTTPIDCRYITFYMASAYGAEYKSNICINFSDPARNGEYEPYNGHVYNISWSDSAGTVYGGTINATTGLLTVTHKGIDMGSLSWIAGSSGGVNYFYSLISDIKQATGDERKNLKSSMFTPTDTVTASMSTTLHNDNTMVIGSASDRVVIRDDSQADSAAFTAAVNGQTLVYELANPLVYDVGPTAIYTLNGINNIFADTGEIADAVVPFYPLEHIWQILY